MNLFYASFIPGLQNIIADAIKDRLGSGVKILKLLDGAVLFETETSYDKLNFFCFNNIFAVINVINEQRAYSLVALEKHIEVIINIKPRSFTEKKVFELKTPCNSAVYLNPLFNNSKSFNTFRVVISNENKPASIDEKFRLAAEDAISRLSGLKVNRVLPDTEFWFLYRREGGKDKIADNKIQYKKNKNAKEMSFSVFMKRLTIHASREKSLHKGELPPPLAWAMCRLAGLAQSDTVLDPFCGYGSIPYAALKHFHITKFIACDKTKEAADYAAARFKKRKNSGIIFHKSDFSGIFSFVEEKSIDAIITDPPWGYYQINDDAFLVNMFKNFGRLLKDGGRAVVLYANDCNFLKDAPDCFELQEKIPILLSGRKAIIYKFILKGSLARTNKPERQSDILI